MSLLFLSKPVILTLKYGSVRSNFVPLLAVFEFGEISPGSGWPYIWGSRPNGPVEELDGVGEVGLTSVGCGSFGVCGVVGHGGVSDGSEAKPEFKGSYMVFGRDKALGSARFCSSAGVGVLHCTANHSSLPQVFNYMKPR